MNEKKTESSLEKDSSPSGQEVILSFSDVRAWQKELKILEPISPVFTPQNRYQVAACARLLSAHLTSTRFEDANPSMIPAAYGKVMEATNYTLSFPYKLRPFSNDILQFRVISPLMTGLRILGWNVVEAGDQASPFQEESFTNWQKVVTRIKERKSIQQKEDELVQKAEKSLPSSIYTTDIITDPVTVAGYMRGVLNFLEEAKMNATGNTRKVYQANYHLVATTLLVLDYHRRGQILPRQTVEKVTPLLLKGIKPYWLHLKGYDYERLERSYLRYTGIDKNSRF